MPQRASSSSSLMRPFVVLALPGMYLLYKYNQYRQQQMETARRRVTERELMHLNTKIDWMKITFFRSKRVDLLGCNWSPRYDVTKGFTASKRSSNGLRTNGLSNRGYAKKQDDGCRRACVDIPPDVDPICPTPCDRQRKKKDGILHRIKLRFIDGGTNFGTPFRYLQQNMDVCKEVKIPEPEMLPAPIRKVPPLPPPRPGVQVSILGADTFIGQYIALLLKQCACIKKLRLYEARNTCSGCSRELCQVVHDLHQIDTNCLVQAYSCACNDLDRCLQNSDIVLMLESGYLTMDMSLDKRFIHQAPIVKRYADVIAKECPNAFILVCASPIDCMVPLVAETLKETGWYNPRKLMGSLAVPEMRASTLAARALCLEPCYVNVPCVGGTEGSSLVPLFSKALEFFDFNEQHAEMMTRTVRRAPEAVAMSDSSCIRSAELSEAHALAGLVTKVAWALLCNDVPQVTGFVETDACQVLSPSRFFAISVLLGQKGICGRNNIPGNLNSLELPLLDLALLSLKENEDTAMQWYQEYMRTEYQLGNIGAKTEFYCTEQTHPRITECLQQDKLLNKLEENEPELATSPEEECVICVNAKATMQTSPCGHRVVCRRCFVKTIQMAVSQRLLPLRCVICRAKILRLRQAPRLVTSKSWQVSSGSGKSWGVPGSVSSYSVGARSVPASASLYSVTSGESSLSGVSSVSSNSGNVSSNSCSTKLCGGAKCGGACLGAVPRVPVTAPLRARQPASNSLRRSQHHSMKARLQDYQVHSYTGGPAGEPSGRLPPIREFQREFREGRRESAQAASASTRIRCAQKIVTQLETSPQKNKPHFFRPLKPSNKDDPPNSRDHSKETDKKKENPKIKPKKDERKKKETDENAKQGDKNKKDESNDNKKNETAEKKKEEKLRLKAEKEAKKEARLQAKEEERQAKLLAKEEERQAKLLAKEEKKKAKKEAKLAAIAEKEKSK